MKLTTEHIILNGAELFHQSRWNYGIVVCPYCGSLHIKTYSGYKYKCNSCKKYFNDKTRTLLHNSKLSVNKWMQALYEIIIDNKISSVTLSKRLGINQKSAWLMLMKIRYSLSIENVKLSGIIAQDEMYIGGCLSNFHYGRKIRLLKENGLMGNDDKRFTKNAIFALNSRLKQPVFGMCDGNNAVLYAMPNPIKKEYIKKVYKKHVVGESIAVSDESKLYDDWEGTIYTNNHHNNQYITKEGYTSNRIENIFSWYKRGFIKIVHCKEKYHQLYLNEFCFRYNTRFLPIEERFRYILSFVQNNNVGMREIGQYEAYKSFDIKRKNKRHIYTISDINNILDTNELITSVTIGKTTYTREKK